MENGKWKIDNGGKDVEKEKLSTINYQLSIKTICPACGAKARRESAHFCLVCGKLLAEDYQPLDTLRSSYRMQGQSFLIENAPRGEVQNLFERNENTISQTAWACFVYSLVPYLGILFIPLTLIIGSFGYFTYFRQPHLGGRKLALVSVALSFIVLCIQILLWWLLYIIPELGRQI